MATIGHFRSQLWEATFGVNFGKLCLNSSRPRMSTEGRSLLTHLVHLRNLAAQGDSTDLLVYTCLLNSVYHLHRSAEVSPYGPAPAEGI